MKKKILFGQSGVTLIELMIALVIGSILSAAIYTIYLAQIRGQVAQEAVLDMQQGLRAALTFMEREIRTAGTDPSNSAGAQIITADVSEFRFTRDIVGDPPPNIDNMERFDGDTDDPNEDIRYAINAAGDLGRETCVPGGCGGLQSLLENVDALNFVYLDRAGNVMAPPVVGLARNNIRQVQLTIVTRYGDSDRGMLTANVDTETYVNQQGDVIFNPPAGDTSRRLRMTTTITCRNLGLGL